MILDRIENASRYYPLNPGFQKAFDYLASLDLDSIEDGRYEVDGEQVFIIVMHRPGKGPDAARLENHKRYIDIQCTLSGRDIIGWKHIAECASDGLGYNDEKDLEFFPGKADTLIPTPAGSFAIFFPEDVHAPLAAEGDLFKVVMKIAV